MFKAWLSTLISSLGVTFLAFLSTIVTARVLGPEGRGYFSSVILLITLAIGLSHLGYGHAYVYFNRTKPNWNWPVLLVYSVGMVLLMANITAALIQYRSTSTLNVEMALFFPLLIASCLNGLFSVMAQLEKDLKIHNFSRLLGASLALAGFLFTSYFSELTVNGAIFIQLISVVASLAALVFWITKSKCVVKNVNSRQESLMQLIEYNKYAFKIYATSLLGLLLNNIDKIYIFVSGSFKDFGLYTVAYTSSRVLGVVQESLATTMYSKFAGATEEQDANKNFQLAFRLSFTPMLICSVILGILSSHILEFLFGKAYTSASFVLAVLMVECVIGSASWLLAQQFNAAGKPGLVFIRQSISFLPVIICLPFIPADSVMIGIALVLLFGSIIRLAATMALYRFSLQEPIPDIYPRKEDYKHLAKLIKFKQNKRID